MNVLLVGLGGFLGAIARYAVGGLAHRYLNGSFPYGTLAVNFIGCFLIGCIMYLVEDRQLLGANTRVF